MQGRKFSIHHQASLRQKGLGRRTLARVFAPPKTSEEDQLQRTWSDNVRDLHKVLKTAQQLFLMLQMSNEPTVRVALELIVSSKTKHIYKWHEDWYEDEERRAWFVGVVKEELRHVLEVHCEKMGKKLEPRKSLHASLNINNLGRKSVVDMEHQPFAYSRKSVVDVQEVDRSSERRQIARLQKELRETHDQLMTLRDHSRETGTFSQETEGDLTVLEAKLREAMGLNPVMVRRTSHWQNEQTASPQNTSPRAHVSPRANPRRHTVRFREDAGHRRQTSVRFQEDTETVRFQEDTEATTGKAVKFQMESDDDVSSQTETEGQQKEGEFQDMVKRLKAMSAELEMSKSREEAAQRRIAELMSEMGQVPQESRQLETSDHVPEDELKKAVSLNQETEDELEKVMSSNAECKLLITASTQTEGVSDDVPQGGVEAELQKKVLKLDTENRQLKVGLEELQQKTQDLVTACKGKAVNVEAVIKEVGLSQASKATTVFGRLYYDAKDRIKRMEHRRKDFFQARHYDPLPPGVDILSELEQSTLAENLMGPPRLTSTTDLSIAASDSEVYQHMSESMQSDQSADPIFSMFTQTSPARMFPSASAPDMSNGFVALPSIQAISPSQAHFFSAYTELQESTLHAQPSEYKTKALPSADRSFHAVASKTSPAKMYSSASAPDFNRNFARKGRLGASGQMLPSIKRHLPRTPDLQIDGSTLFTPASEFKMGAQRQLVTNSWSSGQVDLGPSMSNSKESHLSPVLDEKGLPRISVGPFKEPS